METVLSLPLQIHVHIYVNLSIQRHIVRGFWGRGEAPNRVYLSTAHKYDPILQCPLVTCKILIAIWAKCGYTVKFVLKTDIFLISGVCISDNQGDQYMPNMQMLILVPEILHGI